eukprot:1606505-Amphidinium_carterae.1
MQWLENYRAVQPRADQQNLSWALFDAFLLVLALLCQYLVHSFLGIILVEREKTCAFKPVHINIACHLTVLELIVHGYSVTPEVILLS